MQSTAEQKLEALKAYLRELGSVAVAHCGDGAVLLFSEKRADSGKGIL